MSPSEFVRFLATLDAWLNEAKKFSHGVRDLLVGRYDVERQIELYLGFVGNCTSLYPSMVTLSDSMEEETQKCEFRKVDIPFNLD